MPAASWLMNLDFAGSIGGAPAPAPAPAPTPTTEQAGGGAVGGSQWRRVHEIRKKRLIEDDNDILELCKQAFIDIINKYYR